MREGSKSDVIDYLNSLYQSCTEKVYADLNQNASKENILTSNHSENKSLQIKENEENDSQNAKNQQNLKKVSFLKENH